MSSDFLSVVCDIDNQPYLYNYAGAPHKTQEWVRKIGEGEYNHTAGGLSGVCLISSSLPEGSNALLMFRTKTVVK